MEERAGGEEERGFSEFGIPSPQSSPLSFVAGRGRKSLSIDSVLRGKPGGKTG
jgi:hypothetical protein